MPSAWTAPCRVALALLVASAAARAQEPQVQDEGPARQAEALFQEGRAAARAGDWEHACPKFRESLRLDAAAGTRLNLAECEEKVGHTVRALALLREAVAEMPAGDRRAPTAAQRIKALEARVAHVILRGPATVRLRESGADLPVVEGAIALDPGRHQLVLVPPEGPERVRSLDLREGEWQVLETEEPLARAAPEVAAAPPPPSSALRTAGFVTGGIGILALGVAGVTGALALRDKGIVQDQCSSDDACIDARGVDAKREGRTFAAVSTATFFVGAAALATGIVLVLLAPRSSPSRVAGF